MEAVIMREYGGPSVLQLESHPDPVERGGWVTVRLEASALNWHDVLVRRGQYSSPLPHVPGADGTGIRTDTGERVVVLPSLGWGERDSAPAAKWEILGDHRPGTYAELVSVPEDCLFPRPAGLSIPEAAALSLVGVTTYRALFTRGHLRADEAMLVLGASGGVATAAVSMASALGASAFVTSSSGDKIRLAQSLGATDGVDHTAPDWVDRARALSPSGEGFDLVIDSVGRWNESLGCLRPGGRCVVLGGSVSTRADIDIRAFYFGQYEIIGTTMGSSRDFGEFLKFAADFRLPPPPIDRTFGLDEAAAAHIRLEAGEGFGKIVLLSA
ncbi:zinc-binding dehydrogenase [soil metagenome]